MYIFPPATNCQPQHPWLQWRSLLSEVEAEAEHKAEAEETSEVAEVHPIMLEGLMRGPVLINKDQIGGRNIQMTPQKALASNITSTGNLHIFADESRIARGGILFHHLQGTDK